MLRDATVLNATEELEMHVYVKIGQWNRLMCADLNWNSALWLIEPRSLSEAPKNPKERREHMAAVFGYLFSGQEDVSAACLWLEGLRKMGRSEKWDGAVTTAKALIR